MITFKQFLFESPALERDETNLNYKVWISDMRGSHAPRITELLGSAETYEKPDGEKITQAEFLEVIQKHSHPREDVDFMDPALYQSMEFVEI